MTTLADPVRGPRRPRRRRRVLLSLTVLVVLGAGVLDVTHPFGASPAHPFGHPASDDPSGGATADAAPTAAVARRTLSAQTTVDATLGYAAAYTVTNQLAPSGATSAGQASGPAEPSSAASSESGSGAGVVTALPDPGQVITQGQVLYRLDGQPVALLYGSTPAYRTLRAGLSGDDVQQLNADLVALGFASKADLDSSSDEFSSATTTAVTKLQEHLGLDQTGFLGLGQSVFLPTAIRVTHVSATLGGSIGKGAQVLTGNSTTRQVAVDVETSQQSEVKVGDQVTISLPNNRTTPGVVSSIGTVASAPGGSGGQGDNPAGGSSGSGSGSGSGAPAGSDQSSNPTVEVDVRLTHPAAARVWDLAPVQVTITTNTVRDALVVPVVSLLARSGGGYAVERIDADGGRQLVPVSLGLFDDADGLVQVTGTTLSAGQRVVVPKL